MANKTHFVAKVIDYVTGMTIEIIAICAIMVVALFIGFILVSWY